MTYTYAILQVSRRAWDEIHKKLVDAGYGHTHHGDDVIDMHGIALQPDGPEPDVAYEPVPDFAKDHPDTATVIGHLAHTFYCTNCWRKRPTRYLTPNFGPFCAECLKEIGA